jgi:DNA polymerase III subunit delta
VPALSLDALRTQVKSGKLQRIYVFVGEDNKLAGRMVDALEATIEAGDRPFAVDRVYAGEAGGLPVDIAASCRSLPMLGDRRLVIVLRAERLLKPKRASRNTEDVPDAEAADDEDGAAFDDLTPLEDYLAAPADFATLVFVATDIDRTRRFTKKLVDKGHVVAFGGIRAEKATDQRDASAQAAQWVREEMTREGRSIEPAALQHLVARAGGDISKLRGDMERLLLYAQERATITADDVLEVASDGTTVQDDWGLTNAIGGGNAPQALREVALRFERGDSPHMMVGQLRWWVSNRLADGAPERVKTALDALLRTDLALKSSGGDPRVLLERLVVELTGRPVASRGGWRR